MMIQLYVGKSSSSLTQTHRYVSTLVSLKRLDAGNGYVVSSRICRLDDEFDFWKKQ
jgi:hypothetical protein